MIRTGEEETTTLDKVSSMSESSFRYLITFSNSVGLPIEGFEEEIMELLQRLELQKKGKKGKC